MTERRYGRANIELFFDLLRKIGENPAISEVLHNKTLYFIPEDNPQLARENLERARKQNFPPQQIVFLGAAKSNSGGTYDTFVIKETPIDISQD